MDFNDVSPSNMLLGLAFPKPCSRALLALFLFISFADIQAQNRLYLDAQLGVDHTFAEGAFWKTGQRPLNARVVRRDEIAAPMLRWQGEQWSVSVGYSGGNYGWGYKVRLPKDLIQNPYGQRVFTGGTSSAYAHRIPVLVSRKLTDVNFLALGDEQYLLSFRLEGVVGGGAQAKSYTCLDCGSLNPGGNGYDSITFTERPYWRRRWGGYLTAGATARFYRRGKERATLHLLVTQGLQDMIVVPLDYSYNGRQGSTTLRVRGSGVSLMLGYPFKLHTFRRPGPL
ncbi:hypothetical protein [Hymenobacter koreensis]|uniref:DUF3575 domain-containing protein n=1 Tax=Hymenobacter koreensis TaxID=1084523 RepID=A0ABP8IXW5_9BACT